MREENCPGGIPSCIPCSDSCSPFFLNIWTKSLFLPLNAEAAGTVPPCAMLPDVRVYSSSQSSGQVPNRLNFCLRSGRIFRRTRLFGACLQREAPQGISDMLPSDAVRLLRNTGFASTCLRRRQTTDSRRAVPVARRATGTKAARRTAQKRRRRERRQPELGARSAGPQCPGRRIS